WLPGVGSSDLGALLLFGAVSALVAVFAPEHSRAYEMVKDGMMERFAIAEVYGMHNLPGLPVGAFGTRSGPIMAATDEFNIAVKGKGGHAAQPHRTVDPIVVGAQVVTALQTVVSRVADPIAS